MNKYLLSAIVIIAFVANSFRVHSEKEESIHKVTAVPNGKVKNGTPLYRDGSYVGDETDAIYGNIEVKATIRDGKITEIDFLQYPDHHNYSKLINPEALPHLGQEAIKVQNAEVDIYSGATQTSKAFKKSLLSALEKAKL